MWPRSSINERTMHNTDFDLKLDRLTKVEGSASLDIRVKNGQVEYAHFQITEYKRFFTQAMQRKPIIALHQLLSRICGTSVHAPYPVIGGFMHFPDQKGITEAIKKFEAVRPAVLRTIEIYKNQPFHFDRKTNFIALVPYDHYGFIEGCINTGLGECITEEGYRDHLERVVLPYSQASGYKYRGGSYMVGALARLNLAKNLLHAQTKETLGKTLDIFPSTDIFMSNLAQAIEILHCLDHSLEILKTRKFNPEPMIKMSGRDAVGIGVVEAPRGTLYHKVVVGADGMVKEGEIIVPTGQNQINIENDVAALVEKMLPDTSQEKMQFEIEKLIRAYDPCMSCAAHFLKVKWLEP